MHQFAKEQMPLERFAELMGVLAPRSGSKKCNW